MDTAQTKPSLPELFALLISSIAVAGGLFHLYTGGIGSLSTMTQTSIHWLIMSLLVFLVYPYKKGKLGVADGLFWLAALVTSLYIVLTWGDRVDRVSSVLEPEEFILGILLILVTLEATRKTTGSVLPISAIIFLAFAYVGPWMPGIFYHKGYTLDRIISFICFSENGIFGAALTISSTFIVLFVLFGAFLTVCNGGKMFIDIAYALTGWARGGPAKTAVVSSMLMGMISGSPIANCVTVGTFTIPLMKKSGLTSEEACAVEAVASTGGMIMPPVMGAAAFIMAEYLNMSYGQVIVAAFIPAFLYYASLFFMVDFIALKRNMSGLSRAELPSIIPTLKKSFHLFLPLVTLVYFLIIGWSPSKTVFWSIILLVIVASLRAGTRIKFAGYISALRDGITSTMPVATACAAAGIIVGVVGLTGLGVKFSSSLMALSGGYPVLALVFTMIAALILGCGLPATAVYIILASLAAPALISMGISPIAAHLFVFYFGIISTITPPVALTAYCAAGIGGANPVTVGIKAFLLGIAAYIVPFMFVFSPALLMDGSVFTIIRSFLSALFGVYVLACGVIGHLYGSMPIYQRILLVMAGILLVEPGIITDLIGVIVFGLVFISRKRAHARSNQI